MSTKAFQELSNFALDDHLQVLLMTLQEDNYLDYQMHVEATSLDTIQAITQLLLYVSRKKYIPRINTPLAEKYYQFDYDQIRKDVLDLIPKLNSQEWKRIDECFAKLELNVSSDSVEYPYLPEPHETLEDRKTFRSDLDTINAFG
jgi:hypothetical protein